MRSIPFLAAAALALASTPLAAQDLGMVEKLFDDVSAFTVFYQLGAVPGSDQVTSDGPLHGAGTEVLINLKSSGRMSYELGLGASYLRGYQAVEPTLDLRASLRALPTVSIYATRERALRVLSAYAGLSFGLIELWNAQAYGPSGQPWDVEARAFDLGVSGGLYLEDTFAEGLFVEGGWRSRDFHSVKWTPTDDTEALSADWPRSLDFSGPFLSVGWQLQLDKEEDDGQKPLSAPAAEGTWSLERADGMALPAFFDSTGTGRREVLHGVLRLAPDTASARAARGNGTWEMELDTRERGGLVRVDAPAVRFSPVRESGTFSTVGGVLRLTPDGAAGAQGSVERLAGRLYVRWRGHVLVFAPGNTP